MSLIASPMQWISAYSDPVPKPFENTEHSLESDSEESTEETDTVPPEQGDPKTQVIFHNLDFFT